MSKCKMLAKRDTTRSARRWIRVASPVREYLSSMQCSEKQHRVRDVRTLLSGEQRTKHGALKITGRPGS
jgi:hypothetical protein